jgi:hypothetical protein
MEDSSHSNASAVSFSFDGAYEKRAFKNSNNFLMLWAFKKNKIEVIL